MSTRENGDPPRGDDHEESLELVQESLVAAAAGEDRLSSLERQLQQHLEHPAQSGTVVRKRPPTTTSKHEAKAARNGLVGEKKPTSIHSVNGIAKEEGFTADYQDVGAGEILQGDVIQRQEKKQQPDINVTAGISKAQMVSYSSAHDDALLDIMAMPQGAPSPQGEPGAFAVSLQASRYHPNRSGTLLNFSNPTDHSQVALDAALVESSTRISFDQEEAAPHRPSNVQTLVDAQILPERTDRERRGKRMLLWGFSVAAVMVVFLGLVFGATSGTDATPPADNTTTPTLYPPFQDDLPTATQNAMNDTNSSQYRGNAWMWQDPNRLSYSKERQLQRFALVTFYYGTQGQNWTRNDQWLDYDVSECDWFTQSQESICDQDSNLVKVDLHHNNLQGTIPVESQYIPHLVHSDLSYNSIGGATPNFVTNDKLEVVRISHNRFAGPMVGDAGFSAFGLKEIAMDGNDFFGNVNPMFQFLPALEVVNVTSNQMTGLVPQEMQYATNLRYVGLGHNGYSGSIPREWGVLGQLQGLDLSGNSAVSGTIPSELAGLTSLERMDVSETGITGEVPVEFCGLLKTNEVEFVADCGEGGLRCCV